MKFKYKQRFFVTESEKANKPRVSKLREAWGRRRPEGRLDAVKCQPSNRLDARQMDMEAV